MLSWKEYCSLSPESSLTYIRITIFLMNAWTIFDVLLPFINKVFLASSINLGYLLRILLTLLIDFGSFFIVDIFIIVKVLL